jgi:adenylate kinase family enzyme
MRVVVFGTSGSGKSTFAAALASARRIPCIELDLINWRPGWVDRNKTDLDGFIRDVETAILDESWAATGSYGIVRKRLWARATDLVYLDLPRHVIMRQVIWRSLKRAASGKDVFPGCKEDWARLFTAEHPIRWAWKTYHGRRQTFETLIQDPDFAHLNVHRCRSRSEVALTMKALSIYPAPLGSTAPNSPLSRAFLP